MHAGIWLFLIFDYLPVSIERGLKLDNQRAYLEIITVTWPDYIILFIHKQPPFDCAPLIIIRLLHILFLLTSDHWRLLQMPEAP